MKKFIKLFNKVGGKEILKQYCRAHVLFFSVIITMLVGFSKKSLEIVRLAVSNKILNKLRKKYKKFITDYMKQSKEIVQKEEKRRVWVCWFQGMESAPLLVKKCYESLHKNITDREIVLITNDNYSEYVQFPEYIQEKIDKGIIPPAHKSDLLRLELLYRYGGTWIDATVLCTGKCPEYMLDSELFLFQDLKPGLDGHCTSISNWFMTAKAGNKLIDLTLALLYEYWRKNNKLIDYFIFHYFFQLVIENYAEEWNKVVPFSNATPHILLLRMFGKYDENMWDSICNQTPIHKLSYKFTKEDELLEDTYYKRIYEKV